MQRNNITILILSTLICVDLILTETTCDCKKNSIAESKIEEYEDNNNNSIIKNENNEDDDYDDYYDDEDEANENYNNDENIEYAGNELENNDDKTDSNDNDKKKRQILLKKRRRRPKHVLNMIPFNRLPIILYNAVSQTLSPDRRVRQIQNAEISKFSKGLAKAIKTRHLSGFIAGLGLHAADFADHVAKISKDVINEHQRKTRANQEYNIFGKLTDRIRSRSAGLLTIQNDDKKMYDNSDNINVPFENIGSKVRSLVDLIPAERTKRYYYKHYTPIANEIKSGLNSTRFRTFLRNTYTSDLFTNQETEQKQRSTKRRLEKRTERYKKS